MMKDKFSDQVDYKEKMACVRVVCDGCKTDGGPFDHPTYLPKLNLATTLNKHKEEYPGHNPTVG